MNEKWKAIQVAEYFNSGKGGNASEIAKETGLSLATVDRVMKDLFYCDSIRRKIGTKEYYLWDMSKAKKYFMNEEYVNRVLKLFKKKEGNPHGG